MLTFVSLQFKLLTKLFLGRSVRLENRSMFASAWECWEGLTTKSQYRGSLRGDKTVLCLDCGGRFMTLHLLKLRQLYAKEGKFEWI